MSAGTGIFKPKLRHATGPNAATPHTFTGPRSYFFANEVANIYGIPQPGGSPPNVVVGVISLGGGLFGTVDSHGVLTGGDVQHYWATTLGISGTLPMVVIKLIDGATNSPSGSDNNATAENTLDVETIGGCYPSSKLTIILYIAPNTNQGFVDAVTAASNPTSVGGTNYGTPSVISISWGSPESSVSNSDITAMNTAIQNAVNKHINVCVATGDNGSSDGLTGPQVDFPSSSPWCVAVGGTTLAYTTTNEFPSGNLPNYSDTTSEIAWSSGGGGFSPTFIKPFYQQGVTNISGSTHRNTPDVALVADPATGVAYYVNGALVVYGGTSVSAPIMAAFLASIQMNSYVNKLLYQALANPGTESYFHDITSGSNGAYNAQTGYDNCTGCGTINGSALSTYLTTNMPHLITSVTITPSSVPNFTIGGTQDISYTLVPTNASVRAVLWGTSNSEVASISVVGEQWKITGVGYGTCVITLTLTEDSGALVFATMNVTVPKAVTSITLLPLTATINKGQTVTIVPTVSPSDATNKNVTWSSQDDTIATVSSTGVVTGTGGTSEGVDTTITCTATDGSLVAATATITVIWIAIETITLDPSTPTINIGATQQITATVAPNDATIQTLKWSSSNTRKATVNPQGLVTALSSTGSGTVTITARATDGSGESGQGEIGTAAVTVQSNAIATITISGSTTVQKGNAIQMAAAFTTVSGGGIPTNRYVKWTVTYTSEGGRANISNSGRLIGTKIGAVTVRATALNGVTTTYSVTVTA